MVKELREVDDQGFPVDGYDYSQHLSTMSASGVFISSHSGRANSSGTHVYKPATEGSRAPDIPAKLLSNAAAGDEGHFDRMLEAITLRPSTLTEEMRQALELDDDDEDGGEDGDFEELNDDFIGDLLAAEADCDDDAGSSSNHHDGSGGDAFDYDAHIARLMAEAEAEDRKAGFGNDHDSDYDYDDFGDGEDAGAEAYGGDADLYLEKVLEEYADDEIGELDEVEADPRMGGHLDEHEIQVDRILQEYLDNEKSERDVGGTTSAVPKHARPVIIAAGDAGEEDDGDFTQALGEYAKKSRVRSGIASLS